MTVPAPWTSIPAGAADLRLVVSDMDGTLLTSAGGVPDGFWDLLAELDRRGIAFVPASGRQLATLQAGFADHGVGTYIAENGTLVVDEGEVVATTSISCDEAHSVIRAARAAAEHRRLGIVLCGVRGAYVETDASPFHGQAATYYHRLDVVPDLLEVRDEVLKVAVFDQDDAASLAAEVFSRFTPSMQVVVSGEHWVDMMPRGADKGRAVRALQESLGVTPEQTAVFGDYLNDLGMYSAAHWTFAMADAHPGIAEVARFVAPGNDEAGVVKVLRHLLADR